MVVLDAPDELHDVYRDAYPDAVARGVPFHVTLLVPFVPLDRLGEDELARVRALVARYEPFSFALTRVETFVDHVWLAPEPDEPFRRLTQAIHGEFPEYPPYGGVHEDVVPHATLANVRPEDVDATAAALQRRLAPLLPVALRAGAVTLLREEERDRWRASDRFPLGAT